MRRLLLAATLAATIVGAPHAAAASDGYCCVSAGLVVSYDATAQRISARWRTPAVGTTAQEIRAGDRLGADGVVDLGPRSVHAALAGASSFSMPAAKLALVLASHGGVFVQVRFACAAKTAVAPCSTGSLWSKPVQLTADEAAPAPTPKPSPSIESQQQRVHLTSNGTQACLDAFAALKQIIDKLNANTAAAKRAAAAGQSTAAYLREQNRLRGAFETAYSTAKRACAPKQ